MSRVEHCLQSFTALYKHSRESQDYNMRAIAREQVHVMSYTRETAKTGLYRSIGRLTVSKNGG